MMVLVHPEITLYGWQGIQIQLPTPTVTRQSYNKFSKQWINVCLLYCHGKEGLTSKTFTNTSPSIFTGTVEYVFDDNFHRMNESLQAWQTLCVCVNF